MGGRPARTRGKTRAWSARWSGSGSRSGYLSGWSDHRRWFSVDQHLGTLLVIALGLELLFLTLSVGVEFREGKLEIWKSLAITGGIACMLLLGHLVQVSF